MILDVLTEMHIETGVLIGSTNWVDIGISFLSYHLATGHPVTYWEEYFSMYILVPSLRGYFLFFIQNGKHFGILRFALVWIILQCILYTQFYYVSCHNMSTKPQMKGIHE